MAGLDDIVSVNVTRQTVFPSQAGFGVPCLFAYHLYWLDLVRSFSSLTELTDAGVPTNDPIYKWTQKTFGQNPRPPAVCIGRRTRAFTQTFTLVPHSAVEGFIYEFTVEDASGNSTDISYTVPNAATLTSVGTALAALIDTAMGTDADAASLTGTITVTADAGKIVSVSNLPPISVMSFADTTTDPGIASDLADIMAASALSQDVNCKFFGVNLDQGGKATIEALAAGIEATKLFYIARTSDSAVATSATNDVGSNLKASAYERTAWIFAQYANNDFRDGAWLGKMLPKKPGTATYALKTLAGIHVDTLSSSEANYINGKNGTTYLTVAAVNVTFESKVPSGDFIDNIIGSTELAAAAQIAVFGKFTTSDKVPFTDFGIEACAIETRKVVAARTAKNAEDPAFLAADPPPTVTVPRAADLSPNDKAARTLRGIQIDAKIAGAIHRATLQINLSV